MVWRWGTEREIIYLSPHCHRQNDSCIKMDSDESHFNISLIVRNKGTRRCPQTTTFLKRKESPSPKQKFCSGKHTFVLACPSFVCSFVATKIILVAAPASDNR